MRCCLDWVMIEKRASWRATKTAKNNKNIVILAISLQPPIESSNKISPGTSLILIILYGSTNINMGYLLMCSMAGFSISAITYFGWEVSRNIGAGGALSWEPAERINQKLCSPLTLNISYRVDENISIRFLRINIVVDHDRSELSYACIGSGTDDLKLFELADHFQVWSLEEKDSLGTCELGYNCEPCV